MAQNINFIADFDLTLGSDDTVSVELTPGGVNYTWPAADGSTGGLLSTDGAGTITWTNSPSSISSVAFNTAAGVSVSEGEIAWNAEDDTMDIGLPGGSILQAGQEVVTKVRNSTGTTLVDGEAVYITGSTGNNTVVARAQANASTADLTIGIVTQTIPDGQNGLVTLIGKVRNFDTSAWMDGDELWLSATVAGEITNVQPAPPNHAVHIGFVVRSHASVGIIYVRVLSVESISELHDVVLTSITGGDVLSYDGSTQTWTNGSLLHAQGNDVLAWDWDGVNTSISLQHNGSDVLTVDESGITTTDQILSASGSASAPQYSFSIDPDTGIYRSGTNAIGLAAAGSTIGVVNTTGIISNLIVSALATSGHVFNGDPDTGMFGDGANSLFLRAAGNTIIEVDNDSANDRAAFFGATPVAQPVLTTGTQEELTTALGSTSGLGLVNDSAIATISSAGTITRSSEWTWHTATGDGFNLYAPATSNGGLVTGTSVSGIPVGGGMRLATLTTSNASARIRTVLCFSLGLGQSRFRHDVAVDVLSDGTESYEVAVGLQAGIFDTISDDDEVLFRYTHSVNSGNWVCVSQSAGGGEETTNTAVAPVTINTRQVLEIIVNAAGTQVQFYIDGALMATHTAVPSVSLSHGMVINKLLGTTNRTLYPLGSGWDYVFDTPV